MQDQEILEKLKDKRTRCITYTRVMGYVRPIEGFNLGKKGEHKERVMFALPRQQGEKSNQKKDFKNKRMSVLSPMNERIITKTYLNNT